MADPVFNYVGANPFGLSNVGSLAKPSLVDIDADGDLDAFIGNNNGNTRFFNNIGSINNPVFAAATSNPFGLGNAGTAAPTFVDIDGDEDLDAFIGNYYGGIYFFRNSIQA